MDAWSHPEGAHWGEEERGSRGGVWDTCFVLLSVIGPLLFAHDSGHTQDKILISTSPHSPGGIQTTNDGATILKAIGVDNPAAKVLVGECMVWESSWEAFVFDIYLHMHAYTRHTCNNVLHNRYLTGSRWWGWRWDYKCGCAGMWTFKG